jgi:6-pyruvoyltetrahydropterin/6-carboxytetrahydropterin synthase
MGEFALIRTLGFKASHRYWVEGWSAERNREVFGDTTELHDHDFRVEVEVVGPPDPTTGLIVDLGALDRVLARRVREPLHGATLNEVLDEVATGSAQPSTEFLARWIWRQINAEIVPPLRVARVRVEEDPSLFSEYRS